MGRFTTLRHLSPSNTTQSINSNNQSSIHTNDLHVIDTSTTTNAFDESVDVERNCNLYSSVVTPNLLNPTQSSSSNPTQSTVLNSTQIEHTNTCRYKLCKKVTKSSAGGDELFSCSNATCQHKVHQACGKRLHVIFGASIDFNSMICGKRCSNACIKSIRDVECDSDVKKRVMWHNDGPTSNINSLSCLIDWMTSGNNYNRYRGGKGQTGATKQVVAGEVVHFIPESGIQTARTAKDVQTKISALEESYRRASDWLNATGQGVEDESSLKAAILDRCPYYYELFEIMEDRPTTQPICTNKTISDIEYGGE